MRFCWAFASCTAMADRFALLSQGQMKLELSVAKMVLCDFGTRQYDLKPDTSLSFVEQFEIEQGMVTACHGNTLADAWRYLYVYGVPKAVCFPYELNPKIGPSLEDIADEVQTQSLCSRLAGQYFDKCLDGSPARSYRCIAYYRVPGTKADNGSERDIRIEIYARGPVSTAMRVYGDFYNYDTTTVYKWDKKSPLVGGHAVRIVGWGVDENEGPFWWVANSWGPEWGIDGYFRIVRGVNEIGIEENVIAGLPDFFFGINEGMKLFNLDREDILLNDWEQRKKLEAEIGVQQGLDPFTGYYRYFFKLYPHLRNPPPIEVERDFTKYVAAVHAVTKTPLPLPITITSGTPFTWQTVFSIILLIVWILGTGIILYVTR